MNNDIEKLKRVRELLVTIDMVNGFVKEGSLAAPSIMRVVPRQVELLNKASLDKDTGIIFIRDSHIRGAVEFKTYGPHCLEGTKETEVIDELKQFEKLGKTYFKNSTNLIFAPGFQNDLLLLKYLEKVRLMGCLSDVCVLNGAIGLRTFFDQNNMDVDVCVHADAIDTFNAPEHDADKITDNSLAQMQANGVKILGKRK
jgi:nicotinamidase-related amidase